jgi:hypothetical protein
MSDQAPVSVPASALTPTDMPTPTAPVSTSQQGGTAPSEVHNLAPAGSTPAPAPTVATGTLDDCGRAFDPARHLPRKHPRGGHWLPKGGRKPGAATKATPAAVASFIPAKVPAALIDPSAPQINEMESPRPAAPGVDHAADAGEVAARAVQLTAGIVLKAPKETTASPAEHRHMVEATAAYIRSKNWQAAAGVGLLLMFGAWLLKVLQQPGPHATVSGWLKGEAPPAPPSPATPAAPARPAPAATPGPQSDLPPNLPPLAQP